MIVWFGSGASSKIAAIFSGCLLPIIVSACNGVRGVDRTLISSPVRRFFDPRLSIALPMPPIALLPIFILWMGAGDAAKTALIAFSSIFPIVVQIWAGAQRIDKYMARSAESLGASKRAFPWDIALPAAMPQIFNGLQISLPIALLSTIVVEMLMGGSGVGGSIVSGTRLSDSPELVGGIITVGILG